MGFTNETRRPIVKRFLYLLCALAFCLALTPSTALAAAPNGQVIYVGNENVTSGGYWTTGSDGTVTQYTGPDTPADNYIHYDADTNTLTLHNATIKKELDYATGVIVCGSAIGVLNQNGDAELTIHLEGSNTINEISTGIYVHSTTGGAALSIMGNNTLAINSADPTIRVVGIGGNASLGIENAKVTATSSLAFGVIVQSGSTLNASLAVDGGSLTATAQSNGVSGIDLRSSTGGTSDGTHTVTVGDNAIIRANGSAGGITSDSTNGIQYTGNGIVFDGNTGTVYGNVTLDESLTVNEGETLTIPEDSTLNGDITVANGGKLNGTPTNGTVVYAPGITEQPQNQTVDEGETATFTITATGDPLTYQWQQNTDGTKWTDISDANSDTYTTEAATTDMNGRQYRCKVSNNAGSVTSKAAILTVNQHEHEWGEPAWTWSEDGKTATATFTCAECGETQNVKATVTSTVTTDPTCTGNGTTTYTATATLDGKDYTATKDVADIPATGHKWSGPNWSWNGTKATATFTCKNDASHTQTVTAAVTSTVKTDPTCTENGVTEYTATVEHDGTTYTATKNVADIPATGHDWGEDGHCTICDTIKPGFTPEIIQGDKATWTKGDGQPLSFTSNAAYADFQEARVDGQILDPVHYTVERGSTIVTLKAAYLETLNPGEHTLDIVSSTGTATATFTITAKETQQPADTQQPAKPADTDRTPAS